MATTTDPITDFSRTRRILLLIDLNPLLSPPAPPPPPPLQEPYLSSLLSSAKTLLTFPPLSSSLFSFRLFFSSLSPLLSSSKLPNSPIHLSFDDPAATLQSLSHSLAATSRFLAGSSPSDPPALGRAANVAASMRQFLHDYTWDLAADEGELGVMSGKDYSVVRSNLVIMFSPVFRDRKLACEFLGMKMEDEGSVDADWFHDKFCGYFRNVNDVFVSKDIHFSWVDVKYRPVCGSEGVGVEELECLRVFKNGIASLGWGFSSTESIVLGSVILPFGLIYPRISMSPRYFEFRNHMNGKRATLGLEIVDVSGKPLECKCCELELIELKILHRYGGNDFMTLQTELSRGKTKHLEQFGDGTLKINVQEVKKHDQFAHFQVQFSEPILVCEYLGNRIKNQTNVSCSALFLDRVFELLASETGDQVSLFPPMWKIFLSFLYRKDLWALVSLIKGNGDSCSGILKPFTISSALIFLKTEKAYPCITVEVNLQRFKVEQKMSIADNDWLEPKGSTDFQRDPASKKQLNKTSNDKRKKKKGNLLFLQNLTWTAFYEIPFEGLEIEFEELFFATEKDKSKKMKFFKCWMKQVRKAMYSGLLLDKSKPHIDTSTEIENRQAELDELCEQKVSASASCRDDSLSAVSRVQDEVAMDKEGSEEFLSFIAARIHQGIESKGVDLGDLAERLVRSCIYCLYQRSESKMVSESPSPSAEVDNADGSRVASELTKLLLFEPKDLTEKYKTRDQSGGVPSDSNALDCLTRESELQIFFRMEILRSQIGATLKESVKQKFVKQICLLLESIQCNMEGGFFGDWSLHNYVGKIIRSRYFADLEEVVQRVYSKMDLLLFDNEEDNCELPNLLLNSQDSSKSRRDTTDDPDSSNKIRQRESVSVGDESHLPVQDYNVQVKGKENLRRVSEAQERRERARRFASFTSWVPDLRKVWAPKQFNATKNKSDPFRRESKKKDRRPETYDMVFETPMSSNKRLCMRANISSNKEDPAFGSCTSVSKALFPDDN